VVLTVDALKIAVGKKDIAYPVLAGQHRLLAQVTADRRYGKFRAYLTVAQLAVDTVGAATTRAESAMAHWVRFAIQIVHTAHTFHPWSR
jgi:hypothetical protein